MLNCEGNLAVLFCLQNKVKELTILCFLKDVNMQGSNLEQAVNGLR